MAVDLKQRYAVTSSVSGTNPQAVRRPCTSDLVRQNFNIRLKLNQPGISSDPMLRNELNYSSSKRSMYLQ